MIAKPAKNWISYVVILVYEAGIYAMLYTDDSIIDLPAIINMVAMLILILLRALVVIRGTGGNLISKGFRLVVKDGKLACFAKSDRLELLTTKLRCRVFRMCMLV